MIETTDVVVVGGGPAGSTAGALVARAGHRVVQLERLHHPRHQIGESLLPSTIHGVCRLLGIRDAVLEAGFVRKRGGTFRWGADRDPWTFAFSATSPAGSDYALQVERARFDAMLFDHARRSGVDAREGVEMVRAELEDGTVTGVTVRDARGQESTIRARYVIDASGHGSRLARLAGRRVNSEFFRNVAVYGYYEDAARQPAPNAGNIITSAFEHGWCWFIPLSDRLTSVGAVVDRSQAPRIGEDREAALKSFVAECPIVRDMLDGAPRIREGMYGEVRVRRDWSYSNEAYVAPGLVLTGDAACFIDPVFSSGVHLATYSGMLAARSINTILEGGADRELCLAEFERRYRREFQLFYEFLVAFYDMRQPWDSYYWKARELLDTPERGNEPFIRLVAGGASAPEEFFTERAGAGAAFAHVVAAAAETSGGDGLDGHRPDHGDLRAIRRGRAAVAEGLARMHAVGGSSADPPHAGEDRLVASPDGLRWQPVPIS